MPRKWTDRDGTTWHITTGGATAHVESGTMIQLIVFSSDETLSTLYEGTKPLDELTEEELAALLDAAQDRPAGA